MTPPSDAKPISREEIILETAAQIPDPAQRRAYLAAVCGDDAPRRERLEKLLVAAADSFFEKPLVSPAAAISRVLRPPACASGSPAGTGGGREAPGDRIGRYKLLEKIGEGGCGVVYVAEPVLTFPHRSVSAMLTIS